MFRLNLFLPGVGESEIKSFLSQLLNSPISKWQKLKRETWRLEGLVDWKDVKVLVRFYIGMDGKIVSVSPLTKKDLTNKTPETEAPAMQIQNGAKVPGWFTRKELQRILVRELEKPGQVYFEDLVTDLLNEFFSVPFAEATSLLSLTKKPLDYLRAKHELFFQKNTFPKPAEAKKIALTLAEGIKTVRFISSDPQLFLRKIQDHFAVRMSQLGQSYLRPLQQSRRKKPTTGRY